VPATNLRYVVIEIENTKTGRQTVSVKDRAATGKYGKWAEFIVDCYHSGVGLPSQMLGHPQTYFKHDGPHSELMTLLFLARDTRLGGALITEVLRSLHGTINIAGTVYL
jgi:hypothetical protein